MNDRETILRHTIQETQLYVFDWLRDVSHWISVCHTLNVKDKYKNDARLPVWMLTTSDRMADMTFGWYSGYGISGIHLHANTYPYAWPESGKYKAWGDASLNECQIFTRNNSFRPQEEAEIIHVVDEMVKRFFPKITQTDSLRICQGPHTYNVISRCKLIGDAWVCENCLGSFSLEPSKPTIVKAHSKRTTAKTERQKMTSSLRWSILQRDKFTCQVCGSSRLNSDDVLLEVDHIYPVSKGGKTSPDNLQTLCRSCNQGKRDKIVEELISHPL